MAPSTSRRPRGKTKCAPSPPLSTAWGNRKRAVASITASPSSAMTPTWAMGDTPSGRSTTALPAPIMPPILNMAWSDDMMGRPINRSTATPWAFIDTSMAPLNIPNSTSAATRAGSDGASSGSGMTAQ